MCLTGIEKNYIERDLVKYLRKYIEVEGYMPVHSLHKKRGQTFAFLNFKSEDQKKEFAEVYEAKMAPQVKNKRISLKEAEPGKRYDSK